MPKKILIIEDEEIIYGLLFKKLSAEGYNVIGSKDGEEGFDLIKKEMPDLILLDIILPKKTGFEVLEEKQKDGDIKDIPVIIVSNSGQPVELDRARDLGVKDWLIKTEFDPEEVKAKVKKQIG